METKSLREAIAKVRGGFKLNTSDSYINISDRWIASELESTALAFIKQATDKRKLWNSANIFTPIKCLKMKQVPLSDCCSYTSDCTISRSKLQLPRIAEGTNFGMLMQGVYSIDYPRKKSRKFIESSADRYANILSMQLNTKDIHYWIQDRYLYLSDPEITTIKIIAYFEEDIPQELLECDNEITDCCPQNPYDLEFKCPGYMVDAVIKEVINKFNNGPKRSQDDKTNDGKDDTK